MKERMSLSEIRNLSYADFSKICIQIFTSDIVPKGLACVPCTEEYYLYDDPNSEACVRMRLWCKHLSLFATRPNGEWLISSHIERPTISATIEEAYRQLREVVPFLSDDSDEPISYSKIHSIVTNEGLSEFDKFLSYIVRQHVCCPTGKFNTPDVVEATGLTTYKVKKFMKLFRDLKYLTYSSKNHSWTLGEMLNLCRFDMYARDLYIVWTNITDLNKEEHC